LLIFIEVHMKIGFSLGLCVVLCFAGIFLTSCGGHDNDSDDTAVNDTADDTTPDDTAGDDSADDTAGDDSATPASFRHPEDRGPYLVGNASFFLEDTDRRLFCGDGNRILLIEVWYPAADTAADLPENRVMDFFLGRDAEVIAALEATGQDLAADLIDQPTGSYRDAPLHPDAAKMPVLVFSHGFFSNRFQNWTQADYLASHGYIVVSPDHPCNSTATLTPDSVVLFSLLDVPFTFFERKDDVSFLVDVFTENPPEMFAGRIDADRIGFFGHSFGGFTVSEQIKSDPRVDAVLQITSFGLPVNMENATIPSMYFWGYEDKVMHRFERFHDGYQNLMPAPKYELAFFDTGHFAFADLCRFSHNMQESGNGCGTETRIGSDELFTNPDIDDLHAVLLPYMTAFFGSVFFGDKEFHNYLAVNRASEMMNYFPWPDQAR
jgi:predicted dienelactone hydrolase